MLKFGDVAPEFNLPGVEGKNHKLADHKSKKAVAVIFSCNHCPYVKAFEDRMIALARDYAPKSVQFLLINANDPVKYPSDSFEQMAVHAKEKNYPFPYLHDASQQIAKAYGAQRTPEVFLFDNSFKLRYRGTIDDSVDDPNKVTKRYLKDALDAVVAGREPATKETAPVGCTIKWK
ncbi:thioredoxin family protein [Candidatus Acetothermia bacterium]|nr:thioredoxin family protein [Candidatus Acetothermia bacterium]MBI3660583.1 thioredoxin family protein [Candidatus Acetothermia bacterium]